ncbi:cysteine desulfurase family protein [Listeria ivanovii]|uniref:Putative NifS-like protein required for NAD biosynthesis n=1 Tax=Listeria ivanovii (strain ATCC BAA-678 / PAM 55) TaxID=881621 RepID=G2ZD35_LISIP|nr:cysteine desulfurase family protein [Listeria ivanovii]AHI56536.1 cysteine desulfarase [Listeria ivanovii WSLC3009]AIS65955.1 cysteine desulfurase [Listeria ivanovii subsp. ivanovii]MBC1759006.1 cysteine desulfurase [Listeria ivanovii]MBK3914029.1 cysteine desulfurase [Listeria ivanovii subsp. ivanovii]MBK3921133.1 cysteine desulfurase [Listeria ivanovii subsp. ivanovii]
MIYFDHAATTQMNDAALKVFLDASKEFFANSESLHDAGTKVSTLLERCRKSFAEMLKVPARGIIFTSGGTESNQIAIQTVLHTRKKKEVLVSPLEHASVWQQLEALEREGKCEMKLLPVDKDGQVNPTNLAKMISENTALIIIQHVNSEIGTIQPVAELAQIAKKSGVPFHTDIVQSFGKITLELTDVTSFSISSHKIYGPKGVGLLFIKPDIPLQALLPDVHHEFGFRSGTVNVPAIAAFTTAAYDIMKTREKEAERMRNIKRAICAALTKRVKVEGGLNTSPFILGLTLPNMQGQEALLALNEADIQISTTSACSLRDPKPSRTLLATGKTEEEANRFIRLSFGKENELSDSLIFNEELAKLLRKR